MKIRVSMPGTYIVAEMPEQQARETFWKMSEIIGIMARRQTGGVTDKNPEKEPEIWMSPENEVEELEEEPEALEEEGTKIKGFMYLKCSECGKEKSFFAREEKKNVYCDCCGKEIKIKEPLRILFKKCECGDNFYCHTNMTEKRFDITCHRCGAPVAVEWNEKKKVYETIREEE